MNTTLRTLAALAAIAAATAAIPATASAIDKMFYIGETGYDSWADAYNAAQNGDTITVGANATMAISEGKTVTIDLAGGALDWEGSGYTWGTITVVDSEGGGRLTLVGYSRNVSGATVDLSALTAVQFALNGAGLFWTSAATVLKFPSGMALADCTPRLGNKSVDQVIVVQGVTYTWNGSSWVADAPGHDITITAPQNGTLETSVTNDVAAGLIVMVTATPAAGYELMSVTTNGTALAGTTFEMPSEDVTLAATFAEQGSHMFYIGETGYDSWSDAYAAAASGATITVGTNATFAIAGNKTLTIDLAGRSLEWEASGWFYGSFAVVDSVGGGTLALAVNNRNVNGGTVDMTALGGGSLTGPGKFWNNAATVIRFPSDMAFRDCTMRLANTPEGLTIVVQGVKYVYRASRWESNAATFLLVH